MTRNYSIPIRPVTKEIIDQQANELFQVLTGLPSRNIETLLRIGTDALLLFSDANNPDDKAEIAAIALHAERGIRLYGENPISPLTKNVIPLRNYIQKYDELRRKEQKQQ